MNQVPQDVMCALLQSLLEKNHITQNVYEKCREKILETGDWPAFFCPSEENGKGQLDGDA